jgi:mono/diheme cytochrome c family protein
LGTDTLNITTLSTDLPEYQLDVNAPLTLIPADSQNVIVTFTPAVAGTFNAQMTIVSNSSSSPHQIIISGAAEDIVSYTTQIQPIWNASCTACHGSNGGLSLSSYAQLMSGSNSGATVIPNNAVGSLLVKRLRGTSGTQMPQGGTPLSETTISLVETWIDQGAQDN